MPLGQPWSDYGLLGLQGLDLWYTRPQFHDLIHACMLTSMMASASESRASYCNSVNLTVNTDHCTSTTKTVLSPPASMYHGERFAMLINVL